eukprot:TCONS_00030665-protein
MLTYITLFFVIWHGLPWIQSTPTKEKVFLLVFDGFVHDFEKLTTNMPNFQKLASEGVKAKGLIPPFPSATFPSMTTLSTGLYPESHGIIRNNFYNKDGVYFRWNGDPKDQNNSMFFTREPIWLTNQKQKGHSSVYYWPGYYSFDEKPTYHNQEIRYLGANITESQKHITETFDVYDKDPSLNFMVLYVDAPDTTGHVHGVTSKEYTARIESLDKMVLGYLRQKLSKHPEINLIIVADHGQINTQKDRFYFVNDYVPKEMLALYPYGCNSVCALKPSKGHSTDEVIERLEPLLQTGGFRIFNRESKDTKLQVPEFLHYTQNELIPPILILPKPGWILYDTRPPKPRGHRLIGAHGYDPSNCPEMQSIFYASGPAFKKGVLMKAFDNVNVYPLLAHLLGIKPRPNNGSLAVFKHVLKDWNNTEDSDSSNFSLYGSIFTVCVLLVLIAKTRLRVICVSCICHFCAVIYRLICRPKKKHQYMRVSRDRNEDEEIDDEV